MARARAHTHLTATRQSLSSTPWRNTHEAFCRASPCPARIVAAPVPPTSVSRNVKLALPWQAIATPPGRAPKCQTTHCCRFLAERKLPSLLARRFCTSLLSLTPHAHCDCRFVYPQLQGLQGLDTGTVNLARPNAASNLPQTQNGGSRARRAAELGKKRWWSVAGERRGCWKAEAARGGRTAESTERLGESTSGADLTLLEEPAAGRSLDTRQQLLSSDPGTFGASFKLHLLPRPRGVEIGSRGVD
jgi:hypothetical protein